MTRVALYVRVSTREQTVANQEFELRRWADRLGHEVVKVYADTASGARGDRIALTSVLTDAHRREFDVLLIWSLDRLSREGIGPMARHIEQFRAAGVRVQSHQEPWLDTVSFSPGVGRSSPSSVREILHRELYRGVIEWNRTQKRDRWE